MSLAYNIIPVIHLHNIKYIPSIDNYEASLFMLGWFSHIINHD